MVRLLKGSLKKKIIVINMVILVVSLTINGYAVWIVVNSGKSQVTWGLPSILFVGSVHTLLLLLGFVAVRKVIYPLSKLELAAQQIASGNFNTRIDYRGDDEIGRLAESFDVLREIMANSYATIEEYVDGLRDRTKEVEFLTDINSAILEGRDISLIYDLLTERICKLMHAEYCCLNLLDSNDRLQIMSMYGFTQKDSRQLKKIVTSESVDDKNFSSIANAHLQMIVDIKESDLADELKGFFCDKINVKSELATPLLADGKPTGSIVVWYRERQEFNDISVSRFMLFADQVSVALRSAKLLRRIRGLTTDVIRTLVQAIDARDSYTANHSGRVSRLAVAIAHEFSLNQEEILAIEYAGLLHDIGKIGISETILNKPGALSKKEMKIMKTHTAISADIIRPIESLKDIVPMVLYHHEWYDGNGYPRGLSGEGIPFGARILAVADAFEAMTSNRPYRAALSLQEARNRLKEGSSAQFDPQVVHVILKVLARIEFANVINYAENRNRGALGFELENVI